MAVKRPDLSDAWNYSAADFPTEIERFNPVGQTKNIGSVDDISNLFRER